MAINLISKIRERYKAWQDRRFLKKHHCENWRQYNHRFDPDVNWRATRIKEFYHGYPYVYVFENRNHEVYYWDLGMVGTYIVDKWCETNCKEKYRMDFFRAIRCPATANQWELNDLGGGDYIFVAFKDEQEFIMFMLRWS